MAFVCVPKCYSQNDAMLTGTVLDGSTKKKLVNTSVMLLNKDFFLIQDVRVDTVGFFSIKNVEANEYMLFFSHPDYVDKTVPINITKEGKTQISVDTIFLINKKEFLEEVLIKSNNILKVNGDTLIYNVKDFKLNPQENVESLLEKLPGFIIDQNGQIKVQGKVISKILLDGEEVFGNDPLLVTRNLRAAMVGKVKVYDRKPNTKIKTALIEGELEKVIDLELNEKGKEVVFGKINVGGAADYYSAQAQLNSFKKKTKASAYFASSNLGESGLSAVDKEKNQKRDESYDGKGIPKTTDGGFYYEYNNAAKQEKLNISTKIKESKNYVLDSIASKQYLNNGLTLFQNTKSTVATKTNLAHSIIDYSTKISSSVKLNMSGSFDNTNDKKESTENGKTADKIQIITQRENSDNTNATNTLYGIYANIEKTLEKKNQNITIALSQRGNYDKINSEVSSLLNYRMATNTDSTETLNLVKKLTARKIYSSANVYYNIDLTPKLTFGSSFGYERTNIKDIAKSYDLVQPLHLDEKFTSLYTFNSDDFIGAVTFNYKKSEKFSSYIQTSVDYSSTEITNLELLEKRKISFVKIDPKFNIKYKPTIYKTLEFSYDGMTNIPNKDEINPLTYFNSITTKYIPNFDIKPSYTNSFNIWFSNFVLKNTKNLNINANYSFTLNPFLYTTSITPQTNLTVYKSENCRGCIPTNIRISVNYSFGFSKQKINLYAGTNANFSKAFSRLRIDAAPIELQKNRNQQYEFNIGGYRDKTAKYALNMSVNYVKNKVLGIQKQTNNFLSTRINASVEYPFLKKLNFTANMAYTWNKINNVPNNKIKFLQLNASLGYRIFKMSPLEIKFSCNDILNQNIGFERNFSSYIESEERYNTIKRFFLLSAIWKFSSK